MAIDIDKYYKALENAETKAEIDQGKSNYIRTRANKTEGGSSAFGPVQITGTLAEGAHKNGYLKESKEFYEKEMAPRYKKMLYHGNNKGKVADYNPRYDYGGDAEFDPKKHAQSYEVFAKEVMTGIDKEAKGDEKEFVRKWRGRKESQDPEYWKRMEEGKAKFDKEHNYDRELAKKMEDGLQ